MSSSEQRATARREVDLASKPAAAPAVHAWGRCADLLQNGIMPSLLHELRQFVPSLTEEKLNSSPLGWGVKEQVLLALLARLPSASSRNATRLMRAIASEYRDARRQWRQARQKSDGKQLAGDAGGAEARARQQEQGLRRK